jgi:hypothetical protein
LNHSIEILVVEFGEQLSERGARLPAVDLGWHFERSSCRTSPLSLTSCSSGARSIEWSVVRQAAVSDAMLGATRTW